MKTNLVIGSDGFIGNYFCDYLEKKGEKVIRFDIKRSKKEDGRTHKFNFNKIDKIYFLAWDVGGSKYLYKHELQIGQLKWNLDLMSNIFNQLEGKKKDFLFVSSQLAEEVDTVYGVTKKLGEVWADLLDGKCIRVWNAYGAMEKQGIKSHAISDFIFQALKTGKIKMMTDGQESRQFTHLEDLSTAFYMSLNSKDLNRKIYDASSYHWVKMIDVAKLICDITGAKYYPGKIKGRDPIPSQNMGRIPGWLPSVTLEEGIKSMIKEARELI